MKKHGTNKVPKTTGLFLIASFAEKVTIGDSFRHFTSFCLGPFDKASGGQDPNAI